MAASGTAIDARPALHEEHVVAVECGPTLPPGAAKLTITSSTRTFGRNAKRLEQERGLGHVSVQLLDEERPAALGQRREARLRVRAPRHLPGRWRAASLADDRRLDTVLAREARRARPG